MDWGRGKPFITLRASRSTKLLIALPACAEVPPRRHVGRGLMDAYRGIWDSSEDLGRRPFSAKDDVALWFHTTGHTGPYHGGSAE